MTHEAAIRDLESEKSRLKDKVLRLEEERGALQNKSQALNDRQRQQILTLEKVTTPHHSLSVIIKTLMCNQTCHAFPRYMNKKDTSV